MSLTTVSFCLSECSGSSRISFLHSSMASFSCSMSEATNDPWKEGKHSWAGPDSVHSPTFLTDSPQALRSGPQLDPGPLCDLSSGFCSQRTTQALLLEKDKKRRRRATWHKTLSCKCMFISHTWQLQRWRNRAQRTVKEAQVIVLWAQLMCNQGRWRGRRPHWDSTMNFEAATIKYFGEKTPLTVKHSAVCSQLIHCSCNSQTSTKCLMQTIDGCYNSPVCQVWALSGAHPAAHNKWFNLSNTVNMSLVLNLKVQKWMWRDK